MVRTYENCEFRKIAKICKFKKEDCDPDECDYYPLPFSSKHIKNHCRRLRQKIKILDKNIQHLKNNGLHKDNPEFYRMKADIKDKAIGFAYLSKCYMICKRRGV